MTRSFRRSQTLVVVVVLRALLFPLHTGFARNPICPSVKTTLPGTRRSSSQQQQQCWVLPDTKKKHVGGARKNHRYHPWLFCGDKRAALRGGATGKTEPPQTSRVVEELPPLVVASALTAALTYPLDFARAMRMAGAAQTTAQKTVITSKSLTSFARAAWARRGLFTKGLLPELAKGTASRIVKFGLFPITLTLISTRYPKFAEKRPAAARAVSGALATIPEIALITPLEVTKLALQLDAVGQKRFANSLSKATVALISGPGGLTSIYACHFGLQCRQGLWTAIYFATVPVFLAAGASNFAAGLSAGALGALANAPIDVARSVAQKELLSSWVFGSSSTTTIVKNDKAYFLVPYVGRTLNAARDVVKAKGVFQGLWAGSGFKAAHLGLGGALMAVLQPACKDAWARRPTHLSGSFLRDAASRLRGGALLAGYHPFGYKITPLGLEFLESIPGALDCDLGRFLATLKSSRKRTAAIKSEWLELLRFSKTGQAARIYKNLDALIDFALRAGFLD